jgi:hypothetical protein
LHGSQELTVVCVLQFPPDACEALERRWGFLEPPSAAQQQEFARLYKMLRYFCLQSTRDRVLARLHTMAGTG